MSLKTIIQFIKDVGLYLKKILSSRVIPFVLVVIILFSIMIYRLFDLQIINGESYQQSFTLKTQREEIINAPRGSIYDRNGVLLAYSELAYSVVIEDCGYYESTKIKNQKLNQIIVDSIKIIEENGDNIVFDFPINLTSYKVYQYTIEGNVLLRFLRDVYGKKAVSELSDEEKATKAYELIDYLCKRYQIDKNEYDKDTLLKLVYVRYNLANNSYKRYISFTLAQNVSDVTMASILESSSDLPGVGIEEEYIRKYNYSTYMSHIIGYTGKVSESELEKLKKSDESYTANDIVGKAGIEAAYESVLAGKKGSTTMLVDTVGRVQEITSKVDAVIGNDVYLTIDVKLQKQIYDLLERRLAETLFTNIIETDETHAGIGNEIVMPVTRVYFALIDNNIISMDEIEKSSSTSAKEVYSIFSNKKIEIMDFISNELVIGTRFDLLSEEQQGLVKRARRLLIESDIINSDKITSEAELTKLWQSETISLRDYIVGAINNEWININNLNIEGEYPTTDDVIDAIIDYAMEGLEKDLEFCKLIYKELIISHIISGKQICLILMEQNRISYTESEYVAIENGASPFTFIQEKIKKLSITPAQLALDPCSGSCVLENPNTGELLAVVSYPSYDNNLFSGTIDSAYYNRLLNDKSTPLVNRATQTKIAPGSTFKPLTAIAGLTEGVITPGETINCDGEFDALSPSIKCWINPGEHGYLATEEALQHSCNVFFCEVGYRLSIAGNGGLNLNYGLQRLKKYTDILGLSTKTGIEIPETVPKASDYNPSASSIGQGTNAYTSLNLARYISTVANRGTVYNSSLISKTVSANGTILTQFEPSVANTVDIVSESTWNIVQNGMGLVISEGVFGSLTSRLPVKISGKSGTAEEDKNRGNHACYVMFSQDADNNPEVVATVMIPYGYAASNAGIMAFYAMSAYYGVDIPSSVYFDVDTNLVVND